MTSSADSYSLLMLTLLSSDVTPTPTGNYQSTSYLDPPIPIINSPLNQRGHHFQFPQIHSQTVLSRKSPVALLNRSILGICICRIRQCENSCWLILSLVSVDLGTKKMIHNPVVVHSTYQVQNYPRSYLLAGIRLQ